MKKLSKLITALLLLVTVLISAAACTTTLAPFINPTDNDSDDSGAETLTHYVISLTSKSGLKLNGVTVTAKKDGEVKAKGVSKNGKVEFTTLPLDEYELVFDNLPDGYSVDEDKTYLTSKTSYAYKAEFTSQVMTNTAPASKVYSVGDVMHNFTVTDVKGTEYDLIELLKIKKAVILNFWYVACNPCRAEFPVLNNAAGIYKNEVQVIALSKDDSVDSINSFQNTNRLNNIAMGFHATFYAHFGVTAFPTTVIIDRYGIVSYIDSGSITSQDAWNRLIGHYVGDDYTQEEGDGSDKTEVTDRILPTVSEPDYTAFSQIQANEFTATYGPSEQSDKAYSWPFLLGSDEENGNYAYASNCGVELSFATLYIDIPLVKNQVLSFEYKYETEEGGDNLYIMLNNELLIGISSGSSGGWVQANEAFIANEDINIRITVLYNKDGSKSVENEFVGIRNINVKDVTEIEGSIDSRVDAATNANGDKYDNYVDYVLGEDGYYHVKKSDGSAGALLLADFYGVTPWTKLNFGTDFIEKENEYGEYYRTPYYISFYEFGNISGENKYSASNFIYYSYKEHKNGNNKVKINYCSEVIDYYYMQEFSDNGYFPVDEEVKTVLQDFAYTSSVEKETHCNDNTWLEFCYYYQHFGETDNKDHVCNETNNPTLGMSPRNPIRITNTFEELKNGVTITVNCYRPMSMNRGVKYEFTAPESGVYEFKSLAPDNNVDPMSYVYKYDEEIKDYKIIIDVDDSQNYDRFSNDKYYYNFSYCLYLEKGETIYPTMALPAGYTGVYDFSLTYLGESSYQLLLCTTGDGAWTYDDNEMIYLAVTVTYDEMSEYYRHVLEDGSMGSPVYIDFIRPNFFDQNGHTVKEMIDAGVFDFSSTGQGDMTTVMNSYYDAAMKNTGLLKGMHVATQELVDLLDFMMGTYQDDNTTNSYAWRQMACYYEYYGNGEPEWDDYTQINN